MYSSFSFGYSTRFLGIGANIGSTDWMPGVHYMPLSRNPINLKFKEIHGLGE